MVRWALVTLAGGQYGDDNLCRIEQFAEIVYILIEQFLSVNDKDRKKPTW